MSEELRIPPNTAQTVGSEAGRLFPGLREADRLRLGSYVTALVAVSIEEFKGVQLLDSQTALDEAHLNPTPTYLAARDGTHPHWEGQRFGKSERRLLSQAHTIARSNLIHRVNTNPNLDGHIAPPAEELRHYLDRDQSFRERASAANQHPQERTLFVLQQTRLLGCAVELLLPHVTDPM